MCFLRNWLGNNVVRTGFFLLSGVKRLWSSTVGEDIISRSVASGVKKMQYLPTDLGPVFQRCWHHDVNKHRYKQDRYPQGLYASQVGDAVFLVALESFLSLAQSKWAISLGTEGDWVTKNCASGRVSVIANKARCKEWQAEACDSLGLIEVITTEKN